MTLSDFFLVSLKWADYAELVQLGVGLLHICKSLSFVTEGIQVKNNQRTDMC